VDTFAKIDLEEALRAIASTIGKSKKVELKLKAGTFQYTMTVQGIKAFNIATELIKRESEKVTSEDSFDSKYVEEDLEEALQVISSAISRIEKVKPKFAVGTPQHTLAVRRVRAFNIALALIKRELGL